MQSRSAAPGAGQTGLTADAGEGKVSERLFLVAERLAGEKGLEAVSVRDIAQEANVSLSAIAYHFGSKTGLLVAILTARLAQIDEHRDPLLTALEAQEEVPLRGVLRALFEPMAVWSLGAGARPAAVQFLCRAMTAPIPEIQAAIETSAGHLERIIQLLARALPALSPQDIYWRFHFCMRLEQMTPWDLRRLKLVSGGLCAPESAEDLLVQVIDYAQAAVLR